MADQASESFPDYSTKIHDHYIEGYEPVSLGAPHSSLERTSTWVGMGLVLISLAGFGFAIWALGLNLFGQGISGGNPDLYLIIGLVGGFGGLAVGFGLIRYGRRYYRQYKEETGRTH
ncbi:hypothetical protein [Corynebacterium halotolerans]|uniref:Uncharacterized protein n=1 Tax=Corynebacterium halotolerans YIM 70093 = DSM 44683 TaxID=1121362 RepID=M1NPF2_9CORY|nr:hypothetical protein [Corynebacterium halotolerans]AGF71397.1 hypothetical protein A605_01915 [Corynebacterium halotolerans YIM 70093 = DSM 44683]